MARYITQQELLELRRPDEILRLARGADGSLDAERVDRAISAAEGEVTRWLTRRYQDHLPTDPAASPETLKQLTADLVPYHLAKGGVAVPDQLLEEHRAIVSELRAIAGGVASLDLASQPDVDRSAPTVRGIRGREDAGITLETLKGW